MYSDEKNVVLQFENEDYAVQKDIKIVIKTEQL